LLLNTAQSLAASLALDVRTGHEVLSIDPLGRTVRVRERASGREYTESYDTLVLSTGAEPVVPPIPGVDLPGVRVLRTVPDVDALQAILAGGARRSVIVGSGFIGLEVAEALRHRGLAVTLVELAEQGAARPRPGDGPCGRTGPARSSDRRPVDDVRRGHPADAGRGPRRRLV
jgi:NADPH-dependent 2,4-dienoyl-CoA reductase/sulfur reductase-like enzyme